VVPSVTLEDEIVRLKITLPSGERSPSRALRPYVSGVSRCLATIHYRMVGAISRAGSRKADARFEGVLVRQKPKLNPNQFLRQM